MFNTLCEKIARKITIWAGSSLAFIMAILIVIGWIATGPYFEWSTEHSFFINNFTTIVTYTIIFLLQRSQNKDSMAIQLKLNELIAAIEGSSNRLLNIEDLSEAEIEALRKRYKSLAHLTKDEKDKTLRHTVEEVEEEI
jgi:low affinity Fe/Cu permease